MDIQLLTIDPITRQAILGIQPKTVEGLDELIQVVVLSLLNVPGQDVLDPDEGGGLPGLIGLNIDKTDPNSVFAEAARLIKKTQTEVTNRQIGVDLEATAKLKDIVILSIIEGDEIDDLFVKIRVINEAGQQADVVV